MIYAAHNVPLYIYTTITYNICVKVKRGNNDKQ